MNILELPNEIIQNIVFYLNMRDIWNLKLSNYELSNKIGSYQLDVIKVIRCLIKIDIYWNVKDILYYDKSKTICNYLMWFENDFEISTEPNAICITYDVLESNKKIYMEDKLLQFGCKFYGCVDIVTDEMVYGISLGIDDNKDKLEKLFTDKLIEFYDVMDIYQSETIHSVMNHLLTKYVSTGTNNQLKKLYDNLYNIKNFTKLSNLEIYKLYDYIIRNKIKYIYV